MSVHITTFSVFIFSALLTCHSGKSWRRKWAGKLAQTWISCWQINGMCVIFKTKLHLSYADFIISWPV